jgi:hypothetical protein
LPSFDIPFPERRGDPDELEKAWDVPLPPSFRGLIERVDGGAISGPGGCEYFFDVDDWFGCGHYAVLLADRCSDGIERVAPSFYAALERIVSGPQRSYERDVVRRPCPPGSERE